MAAYKYAAHLGLSCLINAEKNNKIDSIVKYVLCGWQKLLHIFSALLNTPQSIYSPMLSLF